MTLQSVQYVPETTQIDPKPDMFVAETHPLPVLTPMWCPDMRTAHPADVAVFALVSGPPPLCPTLGPCTHGALGPHHGGATSAPAMQPHPCSHEHMPCSFEGQKTVYGDGTHLGCGPAHATARLPFHCSRLIWHQRGLTTVATTLG